jgi:LuxR family maltose regulon positive regulatory protein
MNASKTKELISKPAKNLPEFDARIAKLTPPYFAFKPVSLDLVSNLLETLQFPKFISLCAPVGYGKTVTLSVLHEKLSDRGVDVIWITLDDRDNLLASIVSALSRAEIGRAHV